jgi:hypothetical protein
VFKGGKKSFISLDDYRIEKKDNTKQSENNLDPMMVGRTMNIGMSPGKSTRGGGFDFDIDNIEEDPQEYYQGNESQ